MILFVTALYAEAKPFIARLSMKKQSSYTRFQVFEGKLPSGERVMLLIAGIGKVKAAAAVSSFLTELTSGNSAYFQHVSSEQLFLVNVGIAGQAGNAPGAVYCHTVIDAAAKRSFYPDIVPHPFTEGIVRTYDYVVTRKEDEENDVENKNGNGGTIQRMSDSTFPVMIDMEASGIYEAGQLFLSPNQMAFLKIESDHLEGESITPQAVEELIEKQLPQVLDWLCELEQRQCAKRRNEEEKLHWQETLLCLSAQAGAALKCSVTMQAALDRKLAYVLCLEDAIKEDVRRLLESYSAQNNACPSKREGKKLYEELLKQIEAACAVNGLAPTCATACRTDIFKHIYIEEALWGSKEVRRILSRYPDSQTVRIRHFKDIFNRTHQTVSYQKQSPALILAKKSGTLVYEGAPVCQDFGNAHFYYTSCMMNCMYDCEYCYLQGMYPCGHMVVFVNLEDTFTQVTELLKKHPVYLCVSFDTDLLAMESLFEYGRRWCEFARGKSDLTIEIRTKGTAAYFLNEIKDEDIPDNVILAWTLSPQSVISSYEHYTASLQARIAAAKQALEMGFSVRLCFDPMLRLPDGEAEYREMLDEVFQELPAKRIRDVSIGVFRISQEYLKRMRGNRPHSAIVQYPYRIEEGVAHYGKEESRRMMEWMKQELAAYMEETRIFLWE